MKSIYKLLLKPMLRELETFKCSYFIVENILNPDIYYMTIPFKIIFKVVCLKQKEYSSSRICL